MGPDGGRDAEVTGLRGDEALRGARPGGESFRGRDATLRVKGGSRRQGTAAGQRAGQGRQAGSPFSRAPARRPSRRTSRCAADVAAARPKTHEALPEKKLQQKSRAPSENTEQPLQKTLKTSRVRHGCRTRRHWRPGRVFPEQRRPGRGGRGTRQPSRRDGTQTRLGDMTQASAAYLSCDSTFFARESAAATPSPPSDCSPLFIAGHNFAQLTAATPCS